MNRVILTLAATVIMMLAAYFILIVVSYAYAARPEPTPVDLNLRPRQTVPCVSCINWKKEPNRDQSIY